MEELVSLEFEYDTMNPISAKCVLFTPSVVDKSNEGASTENRLSIVECPESGIVTTSENFRDVPSAKLIIGDSTSGESLKLVSKWLDHCSRSHETCNLNEKMPLPSRILDLKGPKGSPIKLHITKCESAKYACLSHCWGKSESLVLTYDNLDKLTQRILTNDLPKTYTDAIDFCRGLGIQYLWIDALCIIQTDLEDWSYEAGRMSTYYGGCYVCLAATQSYNHDGGCCVSSAQLEYRGKGIDGLPYFVAVRENISHITQTEEYKHADYFPLLTRAWVYQERQMAPRVVHFSGFELSFECSQMTICECERDPGCFSTDFWTKAKAASATGKTAFTSR